MLFWLGAGSLRRCTNRRAEVNSISTEEYVCCKGVVRRTYAISALVFLLIKAHSKEGKDHSPAALVAHLAAHPYPLALMPRSMSTSCAVCRRGKVVM